ncbi:MAG: VWA domain-containing protein, partial [Paracoccaceae bacterium]
MMKGLFPFVFLVIIVGSIVATQFSQSPEQPQYDPIDLAGVAPDWKAISAWPPEGSEQGASTAEANPNPWQVTTLIILDDSGSMGGNMDAAKQAVIEAVTQLDPNSRVGVLALNAGMMLPVSLASDAARALPDRLYTLIADGGTPLGSRLRDAAAILTEEARQRRGFGVFR